MFPNSPLDEAPQVWGWPWHGLIRQPINAVDSTLTLPSGRTMKMPAVRLANNTALWDVGMPIPEVETDDPDEQWLNRAILRGTDLSEAYGGVSLQPAFIRGYTIRYGVSVQYNFFLETIAASCLFRDGFTGFSGTISSNAISLSDLGLPVKPDGISFEVLDVNNDGTRRLYLARYQETAGSGFIGVGGLLELRVSASGANSFQAELSVVAPWAQIQFETIDSSRTDVDPNTHTRFWRGTPEDPDGPFNESSGEPPPPPYPGHPWAPHVYRVLIGEFSASLRARSTAGAWYGLSGSLELITLEVSIVSTMSRSAGISGDHISFSMTEDISFSYNLSSSSGGASESLYNTLSTSGVLNGPGSIQWTDSITGQSVASGSESISLGDIYLLTPDVGDSYAEGLDWSSPIELFPGRPSTISDQSAWPVLRYSNKLLGLFFYRGRDRRFAGVALTPHGPHGSRQVDVDVSGFSPLEMEAWDKGSYNPLTGDAIRNDPNAFYSYV
ncbi:TPA: hypothetical protein SL732_000696 [Pseudomonas aeruginosa]|nr:hypothetical protein [Pseudomonas aeruginosa]HEJ5588492.1 hypothetical protein [Pseudomonas aeruginosa]